MPHARVLSAAGDPNSSTANSTHDTHCAGCSLGIICTILGVTIHVVGSVGINIGQNIQAMGLNSLPVGGKPCSSKTWRAGMAIFILSSLVTFGALALASAALLVPLESVQFVVNILFGRIVNKRPISCKMVLGILVIIVGIVVLVAFGPNESACFTEPQLREFWTRAIWWVYMISTFGVAAVLYIVWRWYSFRRRDGQMLPYGGVLEPIFFTLSSALFGGGQMIVHSKLLAEIAELTVGSGENFLANWFFWLELVLTSVFGIYWLFRLSQCLGMYDPLFIIPLMQTAFIVLGSIAGGIFFDEFASLAGPHAYALYSLGILMTVAGLCLLASSVPPPDAQQTSGAEAMARPSPAQHEASSESGNGRAADAAGKIDTWNGDGFAPQVDRAASQKKKSKRMLVAGVEIEAATPSPSAL